MEYNLSNIETFYKDHPEKYRVPTYQDITQEGINKYPNVLFPNQELNSYRSNCIEFWKYVTDKEILHVEPNNYLISTFGNTWDIRDNRPIHIVKCQSNKFYEQVNLRLTINTPFSTKTIKLHKLILMLFTPIECPHLYQVNHIDGTHDNNVLYNLEWCDDSYNRIHSIINNVGINNFNNQIIILTPEEVHQIKVLREDCGIKSKDIYFKYVPHLQEKGTYDAFRHLIPAIASGRSKLYSQFYQ